MHLLSGLVLALFLLQQPVATTATVRGRVYNPDGQAMGGVEVVPYVMRDERERTVGPARLSGDDGSFELTGLPPGPVFLRAVPRVRRVVSTPGAKADLRTILGHPTVYYPTASGMRVSETAWHTSKASGRAATWWWRAAAPRTRR
jgi:hypothetical protein